MTTPGANNTVRTPQFVGYAEGVLDNLIGNAQSSPGSSEVSTTFYTLIGGDCIRCVARAQRREDGWLVTIEVGSSHMWCLMNKLWRQLASRGRQILPQRSGRMLEFVVA